jgi:hypothetical protein
MSFGRNPHVAKAEAAELKAQSAKDDSAREQAWRDAARQWDRAAERETNDKLRQQYVAKADTARATADDPSANENGEGQGAGETAEAASTPRTWLN